MTGSSLNSSVLNDSLINQATSSTEIESLHFLSVRSCLPSIQVHDHTWTWTWKFKPNLRACEASLGVKFGKKHIVSSLFLAAFYCYQYERRYTIHIITNVLTQWTDQGEITCVWKSTPQIHSNVPIITLAGELDECGTWELEALKPSNIGQFCIFLPHSD